MNSVYALKPRFQDLLRPLAALLPRIGITANQVTVAAAARIDRSSAAQRPGLRTGGRYSSEWPCGCSPGWRSTPSTGCWRASFTRRAVLGGYLNEIGDVVSDAALYAPFALVAPFGPAGIGLVIVLSIVTEFAGAIGPSLGASRRYDGPMGKSDRAVVFGALGLWVGSSAPLPPWARMGSADSSPRCSSRPSSTGSARASAKPNGQARHADALLEPARTSCGPSKRTPSGPTTASSCSTAIGPPSPGAPRGAIVMFHRGHEHSGRMAHLADELEPAGLRPVRLGRARPGPLAGRAGIQPESRHVGARRADVRRPSSRRPTAIAAEDIAVVAQSVGAVLVAAWAHDYAPNIRCLVLASPAFKVKLYVPFARTGLEADAQAARELLRQLATSRRDS